MNKKQLTEQEIRTRFITPAIQSAGWQPAQIREEFAITKGRIIARGGKWKRDNAKYADYVLFYKPHIPIAIGRRSILHNYTDSTDIMYPESVIIN